MRETEIDLAQIDESQVNIENDLAGLDIYENKYIRFSGASWKTEEEVALQNEI